MTEEIKKPSGFMIYADDWEASLNLISDAEAGQIIKAVINYFMTGEIAEFTDRTLTLFFTQAVKRINTDTEHYNKKCQQNAYNRYKGLCKERGQEPLPFEEWITGKETTDDDCGRSSTTVTNNKPNNNLNNNLNNNPSNNPSNNPNGSSRSKLNGQKSQREEEEEFEARRYALLDSLERKRNA